MRREVSWLNIYWCETKINKKLYPKLAIKNILKKYCFKNDVWNNIFLIRKNQKFKVKWFIGHNFQSLEVRGIG